MQTSGVYFYRNLLRFNPIEEDENTLLDELMQEFLRQNITGISLSIERYCRSLTILYAFFYGMLTLLSSVLTLEAFRIGPFSYTQVIICCNMIIPTLFGFVFWKEKLTRKQWVGIFFGITAVPLLCLAM